MRSSRRLVAQLPLVLVAVVSVAVWLPLVLASQTPAVAAVTPVADQRSEFQLSGDFALDSQGSLLQMNAPFFNVLCDSPTGLWAQTLTVGMTSRLSEVEVLLLRRSSDIVSPVEVDIRAVDDAGLPTPTILGHGSAVTSVPAHRSQVSWLTVPLDAPLQVMRGQKLAIFPMATPSASGACYEWVSSGLDLYSGGSLAVTHDGGMSFMLERGQDAAFRTWTR